MTVFTVDPGGHVINLLVTFGVVGDNIKVTVIEQIKNFGMKINFHCNQLHG